MKYSPSEMAIFAILVFAAIVTQNSATVVTEFIFYANATHIMYVPSDGGESTVISSDIANAKLGYDATTRRLYIFDKVNSKLYSMKLDGSDRQEIFTTGVIERFAVDDVNEQIYYISSVTDYTESRAFDASASTVLLSHGNDDLTDIQVDPMRQLLFFAADDSSERDLVVFNITSSQVRTLYNDNSSSIRLTVDRLNQIIYWISYNADGSLILRKTDYSGNTTVIISSFGHSGRPAITQIGDYYYVLDSTQSIIQKYDKSTDEVVQNITVYDGATEIIGANDQDECVEDPYACHPLANCTNFLAGFSCVCQSGYTGNGSVCNDIDECNDTLSSLCPDGSHCVNRNGTYDCECNSGYTYNGTQCEDINECENSNDCHMNATCVNSIGSYSCACNNGFSGNGTICEDLKCYIDAIYLATVSEIYVISGRSNITTLTSAINAKLEYDRFAKRMLYFTDDGNTLFSMKLDGTNNTVISAGVQIDAFTVDYQSRFIYYISQLDTSIKGFPISNSSNVSEIILEEGNVKDLDFDSVSRLLFFTNTEKYGDIGQYNFTSAMASEFLPSGQFPQDVSVDGTEQVVYWTNFMSENYEVQKTYYNQTTVRLKVYQGPISGINLAQGERYLYVLNPTNAELEVIDKETEEVVSTYDVKAGTTAVAVAEDVDECCLGGYCHIYATCTNIPGGYECECMTGFIGNETFCEDINECEEPNICHANATCDNIPGSYTCTCLPGLSGDGNSTCVVFDPCEHDDCDDNAECTANEDNSFNCTCYSGYIGNGTFCEDVDECNETRPCHANATCENGVGNFTCTCKDGFIGNETYCEDINECNATSPCHPDASCENIPGNYTCMCNEGFSGDGQDCTAIDCEVLNCGNNEVCMEVNGFYQCVCHSDYTGDNCEQLIKRICHARGDPHYKTFDGRFYDFMGMCEYVLAKDSNNVFEIRQVNEPCGNGLVACTQSLSLVIPGFIISLERNGVKVNGSTITLPANYTGAMFIDRVSGKTRVDTHYGVSITWNNVYNVEVEIRGRYFNSVFGLCGTFNDDISDDFLTSDNITTTNVTLFGNSWKTDPNCDDAQTVENPCDADPVRAANARNNCSALLRAPFWACNETVNAREEFFIADCEYDMCACDSNPDACLCQIFDAYAEACSAENISIDWIDDFPQCTTPCASSPCFNGGTCVNDGSSYSCECADGYIGDRCNIKDVCNIPVLLSFGSFGIHYQVTIDNVTTSGNLVNTGVTYMDYDPFSRRLVFYDLSDDFYSIEQDGSDLTHIKEINQVTGFKVDGKNNIIYYIHEPTDSIYMLNMTNLETGPVLDLADVAGVKDIDIDSTNNYLVIVKTSGDNIVRYGIETGELNVLKGRDDFPQDVSVDGDNSIVYWVNYISDGSNYKIMSTSYAGETTDLNITYDNTIEIAQDELFLYVLDVSNEKIDKYKKSTWEQMGSINVSSGTQGIEVAFDEDECCIGTFCHEQSTCENSVANFTCTCNNGYTGNGTYCEDIDECAERRCHSNSTCDNSPGSFTCDCDPGFTGDGVNCEATNCSVLTCGNNQVCENVDGIFQCVCNGDYTGDDCSQLLEATCKARGDPHYTTFDERRFDFMGRCEYVLAKDNVTNMFEIRQVNEPCGNGQPSCTKSLTLIFPTVAIDLRRGSVVVNGTTVNLPQSYQGVRVSNPSTRVTLVESDYGVTVEWNNVHNVRVVVLGRYLNKTLGLCGTFNKNSGDDFLTANGTVVNNAAEFGDSWKTDPECENAPDEEHPCDMYPERNAIAMANCSALSGSPFDACSSEINAVSEGYVEDCEYDVCACNDDPIVCLCQAIEAYVYDCNATGVNIDWLSDPRYQQCTTPCASDPCFNGGTCSEDESPFSCSCPVGYTGDRCEITVSTCDNLNCEENEICVSAGDTYECVCHPDYEGEDCEERVETTCMARGDPHYTTFDGRRYDFMGKCEYVLVRDRVNNTFEIRQANEPCGNGVATCTRSLTVIFGELNIELRRGMTLVNGGEISFPQNGAAVTYEDGVNITRIVNRPNSETIVTSHYGVTVIWNNVYNARVTVRGRYINRTVGLCGTYNGIKNDDFWTSYGTTVNDIVEFANSWKVDPSCENATEVDHPCDVNSDRRWIAQANCSTLLRAPFNECASSINAPEEGYIDDCEYDMCACEDDPVVCYCQALDAYARDCASHVNIQWEDRQEFAICDTPCASAPCYNGGTCRNVGNSFECRCPAGFLGDRCEIEDRCQIPYLFYSSSSGTFAYNTQEPLGSPAMFNDRGNVKLSFDSINKRLYLYSDGVGFTPFRLDGSYLTTISVTNVQFFTVDGRNNVIYYHHAREDNIWLYNITSGQSHRVDDLSGVNSIKDLDMDTTNGNLYIATTGDRPVTYYNPEDGTVGGFSYDGAAQSISFDEYDSVVYWANFIDDHYKVMKTLLGGNTVNLNITYSGRIEVTSDVFNLYVLDNGNNVIDKYSKASLEKLGNTTNDFEISELIIGYDEDECCLGTFCHVNSNCTNSLGGFNCSCNSGYTGNGTNCTDVNECTYDNPCHQNATCVNLIGSYNCTCDEGFVGDGINCNATNCSVLSCGENEKCAQIGDIFRCVCKDDYEEPDCRPVQATCQARGDPHYSTFDGRRYDFMGTCEYILAKDDSENNTFEIRQVNEPCGNGQPSCTKSLTVIFPNVTIQLLRGSVVVDNNEISLPASYDGVTVSPSGGGTLIESEYGVTVEWNNVHNVRVTVFGRYLNRTLGLCGTFNRDPDDDFLKRNGTLVVNTVEFGNSWKTDPECGDATDEGHPCDTFSDRSATAVANCSALSGPPFDICSSYVNAISEGYVEDCEYDVCACDDDPIVCLCQAIEAYVSDCGSHEVDIVWLSDPRYRQCGSPCASDPCFNGGSCSNNGSSFLCSCAVGFTGVRCEEQVESCDDLNCEENKICVPAADTFECVCHPDYEGENCEEIVEATCKARGDPHYTTFDGRRYDFMGKCEYVLVRDRVNNTFEVRQANEPCGNGVPTCTRSLTVIFGDLNIELRRGMTLVNGEEVTSLVYNNDGVNITRIVNRPNSDTIVTSHYGLTVIWNNVYNVRVTVRGRYINRTVGLCGTYNGIKNDDFWTSYGTTVNNEVEFANSWKVDPSCENATEVDHPCDVNSDRRLIAQTNCSTLLRAPFNECASYINATEEGYIDDCEYDMCACEDDPVVCYCQALDAYARDCASHVDIQWEDRQEFAICGTPCASAPCYNGGSCSNINSTFECRCPAGFLGDRCEIEDRCQIPHILFSTSSNIQSYNTEKPSDTPIIIDDLGGALLSFDNINKRLYFYIEDIGIKSLYLDGSNSTTIDISDIEFFTIDGRNNLIYFYHMRREDILIYDITNNQQVEIDVLSDVTSVKDIGVHETNGYIYIGRSSNPPIVRYNPEDQTLTTFNYEGSAQSISVDEYSNSIYWANYDVMTNNYSVMRTSSGGETTPLNITYPGPIKISTDMYNLYVLDLGHMRIDKYLKDSLEKRGNTTFRNEIIDFEIGYDEDECCVGTFCPVNSTCSNSLGSFNCSCNEGFFKNGTDCEDVDECLDFPCHQNGTCINTFGSFDCECKEGFVGNGFMCEATNCSILSCTENEECLRVNNIFKCVCKDDYGGPDCHLVEGVCKARGDPHYTTFDGTRYDFMGRCEYVLARDNNTFEIRQVNEPCGNGRPSCTKSLTVIFPTVTIQLRRGSVIVNDTVIALPTSYKGVNITFPSTRVTLVESDYGVTVEWNNVHNVRVVLLGRYLNKTSGLCGTFNQNLHDDFLTANETTTDNALDFGNSWKTDPECENAPDDDHPCEMYPERRAAAAADCSALSGYPFDMCSNKINAVSEGYVEDCEYDVCACDDDPIVCLCQAIEAYVRDCNATGVNIDWLSDPRYQQCSSPCSSDPCFNGGTCSEDESPFSCSCPVGYTGDRCEIEVFSCDDLSCGENEICVSAGDAHECVCHPDFEGENCEERVEATCMARGDPHYTTFDGRRYDFMGKSEYVLVRERVNNTFEIRQANEPCGNGVATCTRSLTVIFGDLNIELRRGTTLVNGVEIDFQQTGTAVTYEDGVNITRIINRPNSDTIVTSHYGVTVIWNNVYNVRVTVRGRYINRTVGLCGTYNGIKNDDFWTSYGATTNDRVEFANSWKVDPSGENATEVDHPCDVNSDRRWIAQANCSTLLRAPFNECANFINATEEGYIDDCEYDMCACEDDPVVCYCQALDAYAEGCASHVDIQWEEMEEFAICRSPCASAPCYNGGFCRNVGESEFECTCPFGFLGDRCEHEDLCQVPILYYANDLEINSYNTKANNLSPMLFLESSDTQLVYDKHNRQILMHTPSGNISRVTLDGSDITTLATDVEHIRRFTYDGRRNIVYYLHDARNTIYMLNLTSMQEIEISALAHLTNIKDLDIDVFNDYLVIATTSNLSLVLYDLDERSLVRVISYKDGVWQSLYVLGDGNIYGTVYNPSTGRFILVCISETGETTYFGISYDEEILVAVDREHIYVALKDSNRIDVYSRRTLIKLREFSIIPDVNELILAFDNDECCSNNTCHVNATCSNTPGSFNCTCNEGFEENGEICEDINECDRDYCDQYADCTNIIGSFSCSCKSGFIGNGINCTAKCEEEILFYSTPSEIISNSSAIIPTTDSILGYDKHNRQLLFYDDTDNLYSADLNGSNLAVLINTGNILEFTYDGERDVLYYLNRLTLTIHSVNITGRDDAQIESLNFLSGITGMEIDAKNRLLVIAKSSDPPIVVVNITSYETRAASFDGSAQVLSVDEDNEVVYWDNFDDSTHNLMKSYYTGQTDGLNISYDGEINLAQDYMHLYVLDKENKRIDKYNKETWEKIDILYTKDEPKRLVIAFDFNECCNGTDCPELSTCLNLPSSFECMCDEGHFVNGTICEDVNECAIEDRCDGNATCVNTVGSYNCSCIMGTEGDGFDSCEDIDECTVGGYCHENSNCTNTYASFSCECHEGFSGNGINCTDINDCTDVSLCHINALCTDIPGSYECQCLDGFTGNGTICHDINECEPSPCHLNATCENTIGSFICRCTASFRGDGFNCQEFLACTDDSICDQNATCNNVTGTPVCTCNEGFVENGSVCEDVNECNADIYPCHEDAFCNNTIGSYDCICEDGFDGNGTICADINECDRNIHDCHDNASCTNTIGDYNCTCHIGYTGDGFDCDDLNECEEITYPCHKDASCNNTVGSFECTCKNGFEGNETFCEDIDECARDTHECDDNASCTNTRGDYNCTCDVGYSGDGFDCEDENECNITDYPCHEEASCNNTIGSYECTCEDGFEGNGTFCEDINECERGTHECDGNTTCKNTIGDYNCTCSVGFNGNGSECQDINECEANTYPCHKNASCDNTIGSYECTCEDGFHGNGTMCEDFNECGRDTHGCDGNATCTNTIGDYNCTCYDGFSGDGLQCEEIDECLGENNCHDNATCINVIGSYNCSCNGGFQGDGTNCEDVDECSTGANVCDDNARCNNTIGRFECECLIGFSGDGTNCDNINECDNANPTHDCHDNATCSDMTGSYMCACDEGFSGNGTYCEDVDECSTGANDCDDNARCNNTIGRFECECLIGFSGDGTNCDNIDECAEGNHTCDDNAICTDTVGSFTCECNAGFSGNGSSCEEINECEQPGGCPENAICTDRLRRCEYTCKSGFEGSSCSDVDECVFSPCEDLEICLNLYGTSVCICPFNQWRVGDTCEDAYLFELDFVALEGLDYNDDLTDKSSKNYLNASQDIQNAVDEQYQGSPLSSQFFGSRVNTFSRGSGTNTATKCTLYLYFNPNLSQSEIDNDNLARQFLQNNLTSQTEDGVQKLLLRNRYVLVRNNQPDPAASVVDVNDCSNPARAPCGSGQRCENYPGTYRCYCNSPGQIISASGLCSDVRTFQGTITIRRDFNDELLIRNSLAWLQLSLSIENAVNRAYGRSRISNEFRGCQVASFRRGSIVTTYVATVDRASNETVSSMQSIIQQQLTVNDNGTSLEQFQLEGTRQTAVTYQDYNECEPLGLHIQDCGTGATCSNEEGTYSCQCDTGYEGTAPNCTIIEVHPPLFFVNDEDVDLVKWIMVSVIIYLSICFLAAFFIIIAICQTLSRAGKYVTEEDEISMGKVSAIVTPTYKERQAMREYYS